MSYNYRTNAFPDPVVNFHAHPPYPAAPVSNTQNHGLSAVAPLPNSSEQALYAQSSSLGNNTQYWNSPPSAVPLSSFHSGLYVNTQTTLGQQQEQQQRYSLQNSEYHQASHPKQHPQHTLPTPSSSAHDNTHPDSSCQTFLHPPSFPATGSQDARCSAPATTTTRVPGPLPGDMYQPPAFTASYDERHKISEKVLRRWSQPNVFQRDQQLCQAQVAPTYNYQNERDPAQSTWPMPPSSFNRRSSSLAHALEPVPSNTPAQQNGSQIKFEELITSQSHNVQSAPSSTSSQSQSTQAGGQATTYPFSSKPGSSKTNSCHVVVQRPRPTQPSMPSSSTVIQIPKLPPSPIKQLPNKLPASPPSSQWSSSGPLDSKDDLRQRGRNVAVFIPPSTMQRMPLSGDGAPIASMLADAVANAHLTMPSLEQAILPKLAPSKPYALPFNATSMSLPSLNATKLAVQQQIAAARKRGVSMPQPGGTGAQHYSPYMVAKEQRDGRKMDVARLAELHAATVSAAVMARRGSSAPTGSPGSTGTGTGGLISSTALFPPPVLASQHQLPQTIAIGSSLGGANTVEESPPSLGADDGYGKDGKLGKKPFLACEFCRHRKIACGKGPTLPPHIVLPPGPRTCNQCFRRGLECQFPEASRRGLRHGKPSRRVIYGENNEYRIVDPDDEDYEDDEDDYLDEDEEVEAKGKGKGKAKVPARPWSPIRFVPAVDTEILKELSKSGVIERGGYV